MVINLALIDGDSAVQVSVILVVVGIFLPLALKASQDMQKAAREMGRMSGDMAAMKEDIQEIKSTHKEDIGELKDSHKTVFKFLLNTSKAFRDSVPRQ